MNDLELIQSFTKSGIIVNDVFTDDVDVIAERIKTHTTGGEWIPPTFLNYSKAPKFQARKWTNQNILDELISCLYSTCQEFCIGDCNCSKLAALARRRFNPLTK